MPSKFIQVLKSNYSIILLYLIVLIPVLVMSFFIYSDYTFRRAVEVDKNEQMARVLADNLDSYIENTKKTLTSVSYLAPIQNRNRQKTEAIFESLQLADSQVSLYWAADPSGKIIAKYPKNIPDKQNSKLVKEIIENYQFVREPLMGTISGTDIISIVSLIKNSQGEITGVIGASIPLEKLQKRLIHKVGKTGYPILVTTNGNFLIHPQRELISKKISLDDPIFRTILKGGSGTLDIVAPFDQKRKFFSYVPLKHANWIVIVIQPLSEFQAQTKELFTRNGVLIILSIFLVVMGAYYLMLLRKREEDAKLFQAEKLSVVGQLAAGMAHEIRNPLTSIRGFAQLAAISGKELTPDQLDIIISEVDRIESIIKETRLLAKPTPIELCSVNIKQLFEEVHKLMLPQSTLQGASLKLTVEDHLPNILGVPNHLKQVLINLIKNSLEAISGSSGVISIFAKRIDNKLIITVTDNGAGIPEDIIAKIGTPFISTKEHGTGLGLMATYRIVQTHGGKVDVQSVLGQGTSFIIELPIPT